MIDGYGGDNRKLNDKDIVLSFLNQLVADLGMRSLSDAQVFYAPGNNIKDPGGWSGFVVIQESHISIHTFPARRFVSADVYTCQNNLDVKMITDFIRDTFLLVDIESNFVVRGKQYPKKNIA